MAILLNLVKCPELNAGLRRSTTQSTDMRMSSHRCLPRILSSIELCNNSLDILYRAYICSMMCLETWPCHDFFQVLYLLQQWLVGSQCLVVDVDYICIFPLCEIFKISQRHIIPMSPLCVCIHNPASTSLARNCCWVFQTSVIAH